MKAVFTGSIAAGFGLVRVLEEVEAKKFVATRLAEGILAEAIDIDDPQILSKRYKAVEGGNHFVVYGKGLGNSFSVFGPFDDEDVAEEFAEANRSDDDEWELFELPADSDLEEGKWYVMSSYDSYIYSGPYDAESDAQREIDTDPEQAGGVTYQNSKE